VAILPFISLSEEKGNEYFADGLVENMLSRLSLIDELKVISRTSSERYREKGLKTVPEIAGELGVTHIVEGSVQRDGNNARITVQLIDAKNDDHIWAGNFDCDLTDIFRTQSEITLQISSELEMFLSPEKKALIRENKTTDVTAYELYNMGRFFWNKRTGEGFRQSIDYFERAISEDPEYGLAYAGLADTYNLMAIQGHMDKITGRNKSEEYALKGLELDANLAEAYTVLGSLYDYVDWEWEKAEKAYQQALEINPNYSTAHQYYSEHLRFTGQHEKARLHINRAVELDPLSFVIRFVNIKILYHQGLFQEALEQIKIAHALEKDHLFILGYEYRLYYQLGDEEKAFQALYKIFEMPPVVHDLDSVEIIYRQSGMKGVILYSINMEKQFEDFSPYGIASEYGLIGEDDNAMDWLEKAFIGDISRISPEVNFNIHFRNLHDNPRYIAIIKKMGLR
jgi:TolB-like protein